MENETEDLVHYVRAHLNKPVVLVGMMGAGKTHSGRRLADWLGLEFHDSDKIVEEKAGCSVSEIFEKFGEEKFRHAEHNSIMEILSGGLCVLATGGGAVMNDETRAAIREKSVSIWLKIPLKDIVKRLENTDDRPLLRNVNAKEKLAALMKQRESFYAEADIHFECAEMQDNPSNSLIKSLYEYVKTARV
jgi:shikimate kinase